MLKTTDLKLTFLGIIPKLEDKSGILTPEQIVSLSALLTFKGKSVKELVKELTDKGQDLNHKTQAILRHSSLRGHASMATTPTLALTFEGSKFLDLMLTGLVFASGLMASGRRTETSIKDVVFPTKIIQKAKAYKLYQKTAEENINFFNWLLAQGLPKDQSRKILQYGLYGTGTLVLPVESLVSFAKERESEGERWMPEEGRFLLEKIEKELKDLGIEYLFKTRMLAPKDPYPYPNAFKDPQKPNLARDLRRQYTLKKGLSQLVSFTPLGEFDCQKSLRDLIRDYNLMARAVFLTRASLCVWTEKKRHRTAFMVADSVYRGIEEACQFFKKNKSKIKQGQLNETLIKKADWHMAIPPAIWADRDLSFRWLKASLALFEVYQKLLKLGIPPSEAIFIIPRGVKFDMVTEYNLYNLIAGYLPLRLCSTADEQIQALAYEEARQIKKSAPWLGKYIAPKCFNIGWCPEENFCGKIQQFDKHYNQKKHEQRHRELEEKIK